MKKELTTKQAMRYSRHVLLSGFDLDKQEILINSKVLILGVGGLGCAVCQYLAASGVGALTLVDDDKVELTNLQRQVLHLEKNIGKPKVSSAEQMLVQINSEISIRTVNQRLSSNELPSLVAEHDLVVDCTDNLSSRNQINLVCYQSNTPLVSGAAIRMEGQLFSVLPDKKSACYACYSHYFGEQNLSCVESGVMSPLVGVIGTSQALEAIKILTHYGEPFYDQLKLFDAMDHSWRTVNVVPHQECKVCGHTR
ncbi:molybdopterin-synthase adenylyltransferase MoeB [Pseudidiomarina taiwanensis]